jgi:SAM-dependent methyltransferase
LSCFICSSSNFITILNKKEILVWDGSNMSNNGLFISNLRQCNQCGHVYQNVPIDLSKKLFKIYNSGNAQASTQTGDGSWGKERAKLFLKNFDYSKYNSAIEIGCGNGYLLKFLENYGYNTLIGIDPSLLKNYQLGKIEFIKEFANEETFLKKKVDLIFSYAVFEHIKNINGVLKFCKNHLNKDGELFFGIPNSEIELERGDPGLFIHQHLNYYTEDVLKFLLARNGFELKSIIKECNAIYVSAKLNMINLPKYSIKLYKEYSYKLEKKLNQFKEIIKLDNNIIIHGANNKLNNILGWVKPNFNFTLIDNDENKLNKIFFGQKVRSLRDINLSDYKNVLIVPTCFFNDIKNDYIDHGFKGNFYHV